MSIIWWIKTDLPSGLLTVISENTHVKHTLAPSLSEPYMNSSWEESSRLQTTVFTASSLCKVLLQFVFSLYFDLKQLAKV